MPFPFSFLLDVTMTAQIIDGKALAEELRQGFRARVEALTAKDRPYKKGKARTESLAILGNFKLNGHIDPDLFDIFIRDQVYLQYARDYLEDYQIDAVDASKIPGYTP